MTAFEKGDKIVLTVIIDHFEDSDDPSVLCRTDSLPSYSFVIPAWVLSTGRITLSEQEPSP